jgi:hypothetical protein
MFSEQEHGVRRVELHNTARQRRVKQRVLLMGHGRRLYRKLSSLPLLPLRLLLLRLLIRRLSTVRCPDRCNTAKRSAALLSLKGAACVHRRAAPKLRLISLFTGGTASRWACASQHLLHSLHGWGLCEEVRWFTPHHAEEHLEKLDGGRPHVLLR